MGVGCWVMGVGYENGEHDTLVEAPIKTTAISAPAPELMRLWMNSCALCHVKGVGGAPIVGKFDWADRLEQGNELLLQHTIEGYNNMPPLGVYRYVARDDTMLSMSSGDEDHAAISVH
jgi:cytochrome c5